MKRYLILIVVLCVLILGMSRIDAVTTLPHAELKYRVIDAFDGELYVHRCSGMPYGPLGNIPKPFSDIAQDTETFQVILNHLGWAGVLNTSEEQKTQITGEASKLDAVRLEPVSSGYQFLITYFDASKEYQGVGTVSNQGIVMIQSKGLGGPICPLRCLIGDTLIDTPSGQIPVKDLREGMTVWTVSSQGKRYAAPVLKIVHVSVPWGHPIIHLRLSDGRELWASPGHPTTDGRVIGNLKQGDIVDKAKIVSLEEVAYPDTMTYDILPAGETGSYFANGILMGSTLAPALPGADNKPMSIQYFSK